MRSILSSVASGLLTVLLVIGVCGRAHANAALEDSTFAESFWAVTYLEFGGATAYYTGPNDVLHYNRVEGAALGLGVIVRNLPLQVNTKARASYGTSDKRWKYELTFVRPLGPGRRVFVGVGHFRLLAHEEDERVVSVFSESYATLLKRESYRNYYLRQGVYGYLLFRPSRKWRIEIGALDERQSSVQTRATYSLFARERSFPTNPRIADGLLRAAVTRLRLSTRQASWLLRRSNGWTLEGQVIHSASGVFGGDFDYTQIKGSITRYQVTTERGWVEVRLYGGIGLRELPPQKLLDLGGGVPFYRPFGSLRGVDYDRFNGDRVIGVVADHHFEGTFARFLPLPMTAVFGLLEFVFFAGAGWSDMSAATAARLVDDPVRPTDGLYAEAGISFQDRFGLFRWDLGGKAGDPGMNNVWTTVNVNF